MSPSSCCEERAEVAGGRRRGGVGKSMICVARPVGGSQSWIFKNRRNIITISWLKLRSACKYVVSSYKCEDSLYHEVGMYVATATAAIILLLLLYTRLFNIKRGSWKRQSMWCFSRWEGCRTYASSSSSSSANPDMCFVIAGFVIVTPLGGISCPLPEPLSLSPFPWIWE